MKIGVPKETFQGERRVSLTPKVCAQLIKLGHSVFVESGAGHGAGFADESYRTSGCEVTSNRKDVFAVSEILTQVRALGANPRRGVDDIALMRRSQIVVGLCDALQRGAGVEEFAQTGITAFALELLPRTTKAQSMDVLSSQSTLVGYYSVILAATQLPRIFPMLMTAAGTTKSAKVLVIGAGVAGLQAIATARRLGAVVHGYDLRPAAMEQIQSLGAKVVPLELENGAAAESGGYASQVSDSTLATQRKQLERFVADSDVVISTAAVPGKKAPVLISEAMVAAMRPGSVILDLASETGGNCEVTSAGENVDYRGVTIMGPTNLASAVAGNASEMFAQNILQFLNHLFANWSPESIEGDEILRSTLLAANGEIINARVRELSGLSPLVSTTNQVSNL